MFKKSSVQLRICDNFKYVKIIITYILYVLCPHNCPDIFDFTRMLNLDLLIFSQLRDLGVPEILLRQKTKNAMKCQIM